MALKGAVRYRPKINSSMEATIAGLDTTVTPPTGIVIATAQLVAFDDEAFASITYTPGDPETEKHLFVVYQEPVQMALEVFHGLDMTAAQALWSTALATWKERIGIESATTMYTSVYSALVAAPLIYS